MAKYRCATDRTDLTPLVEAEIGNKAGNVIMLDVVVEGLVEGREPSRGQSLLATDAESRQDLEAVMVRCPTDKTENIFVVQLQDQ